MLTKWSLKSPDGHKTTEVSSSTYGKLGSAGDVGAVFSSTKAVEGLAVTLNLPRIVGVV